MSHLTLVDMSQHKLYPHVFEPLDLGCMVLPNRILMGSVHRS